jgi:hypothetical protein
MHLTGFRILQAEGFLEILEAGWQHTGIDTWSFSNSIWNHQF